MKMVCKMMFVAGMCVLTVDCHPIVGNRSDSRSDNLQEPEHTIRVVRKSTEVKNVNNTATGDMRQYSNDHIQLQLN